jgi:hypothetical protein
VGADPATVNNGNFTDLITLQHLQVFAFSGKNHITDTATWSSTGTSFTVGTGSNFPVGMPITFTTTPPTGYTANIYYFVTSQSGNTIQVAPYRSASATAATATGSCTISQYGYPLVELGGPNAGSISDFHFSSIVTEGPGPQVYLENAVNGYVESIETTPGATTFVARNSGNILYQLTSGGSTDFDATSSSNGFLGGFLASSNNQNPANGTFFDERASVNVWVDLRGMPSGLPLFRYSPTDGGWFQALAPFSDIQTATITATSALYAVWSGCVVATPAANMTLTLPNIGASYKGCRYRIINTAATYTCAVTGYASNQLIGAGTSGATKSTVTLGQYQVVDMTCIQSGSGTYYWAIWNTNGTLS